MSRGNPGELRLAVSGDPHSLDPLLSQDSDDEMQAEFGFDLLVASDDRGRDIPDLAAVVPTKENGGISRDGLTVTYHLRRGVRWHDGAPFTSHDVKFSFDAVRNPRNNVSGRSNFDDIRAVGTPDALTVVVRLKAPSAPIVTRFFGDSDNPVFIVPAHLLERYAEINDAPFNANPIGTGPFKFVRWDHGDRIVYEANADYFRGKPKLRGIVVRFVPDQNTTANLLRTHELDLSMLDGSSFQMLVDVPGLARRLVPLNGYSAFVFNLKRPLVSDPRLRAAIAYAVDKRALVDKNTFGLATLATADLPPESWAYDPHVPTYAFDPGKARALLDADGWRLGTDGIRSKGGQRLTLAAAEIQGFETSHNLAIQLQAMLHDVGIDVETKSYPFNLIYAPAAAGGVVQKGDYDLMTESWIAGADPDNSSQFTCASLPPSNSSRYCNAEVDAAERAQVATYDRAARKRAFAVIERHVAGDLPAIWLYWPKRRFVMNPNLRGFAPNCCGFAWNAVDWSL